MPIIKKVDGWYWGSKGPFATKEKARSVEEAAFASGYKGSTGKKRSPLAKKKAKFGSIITW
jgi:hypothetical protein